MVVALPGQGIEEPRVSRLDDGLPPALQVIDPNKERA